MDDLHMKLTNLLVAVPDCITNRQKLRAALNDFLPGKKLEVNTLLFAYDENIVYLLRNSTDATLQALQIIRALVNEYGLTRELATKAVVTWCYILGKNEVSQVLSEIPVVEQRNGIKHETTKKYVIGLGMYRAGYDFKSGDIRLKHLTEDLKNPNYKDESILGSYTIDCFINDTPQLKGAKKVCSFVNSCHIEIGDGKYLIIKCGSFYHSLIKIELAEYD